MTPDIDDIVMKWEIESCPPFPRTEDFIALARAAFNAGLEAGAKVAENEPVLPGEMPNHLTAFDRDELCRAAVRCTKANIARAIRNLKEQQP